MATTATYVRCSAYELVYSVVVDAAGGTDQQDVLTDMATTLNTAALRAASPLYQLLNNFGVAFVAQADARAAVRAWTRMTHRVYAIASGAGGAYPKPLVDPNINGGAVGNFRLDFTAIKHNPANTCTYICTIEFRHSIEQ